jgi:DNA-binding transcriptional ArsR family regulator
MTSYVRQRLAKVRAEPAFRRGSGKGIAPLDQRNVAAELLSGLGYSVRLLIIINLLDQERTVSDLASRIGCSRSTMSQHLGKLLELDIVEWRLDSGWRYYSCKSQKAKLIVRLLDRLASDEMIPS